MSVIEKAIEWALGIANDSAHGYDQTSRWGPDYDCSSLVISAFKAAGLPLTATYTGNMRYDFLRNGFVDASELNVVEFNMGAGLRRGDVLLNEQKHTAIYLGDGTVVQASINEKGTIKDGTPGDQTGGEINISRYRNYPWDCVLRYMGETGEEAESERPIQSDESYTSVDLPVLQQGAVGSAVLSMQLILIHKWAISCGPDGADGDFGPNTRMALMKFQSIRNLESDGICGAKSWSALVKGGE